MVVLKSNNIHLKLSAINETTNKPSDMLSYEDFGHSVTLLKENVFSEIILTKEINKSSQYMLLKEEIYNILSLDYINKSILTDNIKTDDCILRNYCYTKKLEDEIIGDHSITIERFDTEFFNHADGFNTKTFYYIHLTFYNKDNLNFGETITLRNLEAYQLVNFAENVSAFFKKLSTNKKDLQN